ncbi:hypothetical protein BH23BAC1_BH23BAC1_29750 [soil metagenome]
MNPFPELVNGKNLCLAEPGRQYLIYTQEPEIKLTLEPGLYKVSLISPRTGEITKLGTFEGAGWTYPSKIGNYGKDIKEEENKKTNFAPLGEKWAVKLIRI